MYSSNSKAVNLTKSSPPKAHMHHQQHNLLKQRTGSPGSAASALSGSSNGQQSQIIPPWFQTPYAQQWPHQPYTGWPHSKYNQIWAQ